MYFEEDEYYEDEDDVYTKKIRKLLIEDDEINEIEDAFMDGYENS